MHTCIFEFSDKRGQKSALLPRCTGEKLSSMVYGHRRYIDYVQINYYDDYQYKELCEYLNKQLPEHLQLRGKSITLPDDIVEKNKAWYLDFAETLHTKIMDEIRSGAPITFEYTLSHPTEVGLSCWCLFLYKNVLYDLLQFIDLLMREKQMRNVEKVYLAHIHDIHE